MKLKTQILSFFLLIVLSFNSYAQVPQGFNYQAIARDNTGNVLPNQAISIKISILDSSSTGQIIYSETASNRKTARDREKYLKSAAGRKFVKKHFLK